MPTWTQSTDLILRVLAVAVASLFIALITRNSNYDLHFKLRKSQEPSERIQMIELSESQNIEAVVSLAEQLSAKKVIYSDQLSRKTDLERVPYSINGFKAGFINLQLQQGNDGILRHASLKMPGDLSLHATTNNAKIINFRGPQRTFSTLSTFDLKENPPNLQGKWVLIGSSDSTQSFTTPVGLLKEIEVIANILDNHIEDRFIERANFPTQLALLTTTLLISTLILLFLPSTLALLSTFIFAVFYLSLSLWIFDTFALWTPILTPLIQIFLTLLLISNYKYVLNERTRWGLEKDSLLFQEVEEMKTNFLSLFSHDLKTPLAKIIGLTELISSRNQDPDLKSDLDKIHSASRELERYIKRILKMSQVQSKNISLYKTPVDINSLVEKSLNQNQFSAQQKNIKIIKDIKPLFMIEVDGPLIQEVINNFLENAITYSSPGSQVTIKTEETSDFIKVSVTDQGQGIPKSAQDSIWERAYRFDNEQSGYGLGLYLSRYVIELHGGRVYLKSKEGVGSEFGFTLPITDATTEAI